MEKRDGNRRDALRGSKGDSLVVLGFLPRLVSGGSSGPVSSLALSDSSTRRRPRLLTLGPLNSDDGFVSGFVTGAFHAPVDGVSTLKVNCIRLMVPGFAF